MTTIGIHHLLRYDSLQTLIGLLRCAFAPSGGSGPSCAGVERTVEAGRHGIGRTLPHTAESGLQETAQLQRKTPRRVILGRAISQSARALASHPWPARHPAEVALLAKSARSHHRQGWPHAGAVDATAAANPAAAEAKVAAALRHHAVGQ